MVKDLEGNNPDRYESKHINGDGMSMNLSAASGVHKPGNLVIKSKAKIIDKFHHQYIKN